MTHALKMDHPDRRRRLDHMAQGVIGTAADRPEGPLKVAGSAKYAAEWNPDRLCHGVLVRAAATKGKLKAVKRDAVLSLPGVLAVLSGERLLRNPAQGTANEAPVQGSEDIDYFGQPVALVVAETFEQARDAAIQLELDIEPQGDAALDPETAPGERPDKKQSSMGDLDEAMRKAPHSLDVTYTTPVHSSAPMEPHASIAMWDGDQLTLHGSYQMLKYNRNELADSLGIDPSKVRILAPYVGGGFGSKLGIAPEAVAAALAARELQRPVCVVMPRQQVFESTMRRSETRQRVRLAADNEGRLSGIGHEVRVSNLPDEDFAEPATQATPFMYRGENRVIGQEIVRLNRTCAGSVRAPGEAVGVTVFENAMDELAEATGIDPVELRVRNIPDEDPTRRVPFSSHRLEEALRQGAQAFGWEKRQPKPRARREGEWLIGLGMASAIRVNRITEAKARVMLNPDGRALVETDMTDIGTGTYAILAQIAAEMLGLPLERVDVQLGDTNFPSGSGSGGSFGASSTGSAVFLACESIRQQIAGRLGCKEADLTLKDDQAIADNRTTGLAELLAGQAIKAEGHIQPGETAKAVRQASYGAYFAEVAVSAVTGEARVRRMLGAFSAGRILNHKTARSQCIGGMVWGIGMALTEELVFDRRDGHVVNNDLAEYHIPVNADVPQIDVLLLEDRDEWASPLQSKGIGELGICGAAASVTNAIYNATGIRVRDYPATLDKLLG